MRNRHVTAETSLEQRISEALGEEVVEVRALSGGCVGEVYAATMADGARYVVKNDDRRQPSLDVEGYMLDYLSSRSDLPVPAVHHAAPRLLIMSYLRGESHFNMPAQQHAADLLATLHEVGADHFGLERDTLIGSLHQPNEPQEVWIPFFREKRLLYMAGEAQRAGRLPTSVLPRIEALAARLEEWLTEPQHPSLIHGDVWTSNVLADGDRITGFLDPAIYYAHPEIELAFITLFNTFGEPFFQRYREHHPLDGHFFDKRRHIYNLYPLLVHVRLFGGSYVRAVTSTLERFGF